MSSGTVLMTVKTAGNKVRFSVFLPDTSEFTKYSENIFMKFRYNLVYLYQLGPYTLCCEMAVYQYLY